MMEQSHDFDDQPVVTSEDSSTTIVSNVEIKPATAASLAAEAVRLRDIYRQQKKAASETYERLEAILYAIPELLVEEGLKKVTLQSGHTISTKREVFGTKKGDVDSQEFVHFLMAHAMEYLLAYSPPTLRSLVKEMAEDDERPDGMELADWIKQKLPEDAVAAGLVEMLNVSEKFKATIRKSG